MNRRDFIKSLGIGVIAAPIVAKAMAEPPEVEPWINEGEDSALDLKCLEDIQKRLNDTQQDLYARQWDCYRL